MIDGTYLLTIVIGIIIIGALLKYAAWEEQDDRRRRERLVHRNLQRMGGNR
jgi:hypothetical protein